MRSHKKNVSPIGPGVFTFIVKNKQTDKQSFYRLRLSHISACLYRYWTKTLYSRVPVKNHLNTRHRKRLKDNRGDKAELGTSRRGGYQLFPMKPQLIAVFLSGVSKVILFHHLIGCTVFFSFATLGL